jgi:hypothetical protein
MASIARIDAAVAGLSQPAVDTFVLAAVREGLAMSDSFGGKSAPHGADAVL